MHSEYLCSVFSSPNTARVIKSGRMRWMVQVAHTEKNETIIRFGCKILGEETTWGSIDVDGRIILKLILYKYCMLGRPFSMKLKWFSHDWCSWYHTKWYCYFPRANPDVNLLYSAVQFMWLWYSNKNKIYRDGCPNLLSFYVQKFIPVPKHLAYWACSYILSIFWMLALDGGGWSASALLSGKYEGW